MGWKECLRNDLFCIEKDVKPELKCPKNDDFRRKGVYYIYLNFGLWTWRVTSLCRTAFFMYFVSKFMGRLGCW